MDQPQVSLPCLLMLHDDLTVRDHLGGDLWGERMPAGQTLESAVPALVPLAREALQTGRPASATWGDGCNVHAVPVLGGGLVLVLDGPPGPAAPRRCGDALIEARRQMMNGLQVMRSIIRRSAERAQNVPDYAMRLEARMDAIAPALGRLISSPAAGIALSSMIYETLDAHGIGQWAGTCTVSGPDLLIAGQAAPTLALLFHELAMNAAEHGVLTGDSGDLAVTWCHGGDLVEIVWSERGSQFVPGTPGFGMLIMDEALAYDLDASVSRSATEDEYRVVLALPALRLMPASG